MSSEIFPVDILQAVTAFFTEVNTSPDLEERLKKRLYTILQKFHSHKLYIVKRNDTGARQDEWIVILERPNAGTLVMAYGPERPGVWMLHDSLPSSSNILAMINDQEIKFQTLVGILDFCWSDQQIVRQILRQGIIATEAKKYSIAEMDISNEEIQAAIDDWRRQKGLHSASATESWIRKHNLTEYKLSILGREFAWHRKLESIMVTDEMIEMYHSSRNDLYRIEGYKAIFNKKSSAAETVLRCENHGEVADLVAALVLNRQCISIEAVDMRSDVLEGDQKAPQIDHNRRAIGPFLDARGWAVIFVSHRELIKTSPREFAESRRILFNDIIDGKIRTANVTWYWGDTQRLVNQPATVEESEKGFYMDLHE